MLPDPIKNVIDELGKLPSIGQKTAERLAFYLLRNKHNLHKSLGAALTELKDDLCFCTECFNIAVNSPCKICSHTNRDSSLICVVEEPLDVIAIEKTGSFGGHYHVLHGVISPIDGVGVQDIRVNELINRVTKPDTAKTEIILALNPSLEGEATSMHIQSSLQSYEHISITRIARGLPMGGDLEYADKKTLAKALEGRTMF